MIELIKGSIFDSKCDLLVIPCNSKGGVSESVRKELVYNNLPYLHQQINVGEIVFINNIGRFTNSSVIGYAASVEATNNISSFSIIQQILKQIRDYCELNHLSKVNIPLLGTGAGKLSVQKSYEAIKLEFEKDTKITLCVYVFSMKHYNELFYKNEFISNTTLKNPRVFISYTSTNNNRDWVKNFACRLRKCGVNARLDQWHLKPGNDLAQWMTNELMMADKVLLICDKAYAEKANDRKGGVGWETMIIQGDMLSNQDQDKYIAIVREPHFDESLPIYVKSKYALNWYDESKIEEEFNNLLLYLFDCNDEPPIGEIPSFIIEKMNK